MKKISKYLIPVIFLLSIFINSLSFTQSTSLAANTDEMQVHFIDVGQGDSTLVTCGGHAMLIDAGDDFQGTAIQNYLQKQGIKKLDYLILTHPDSDHIGGAPVIITKFSIDKVFVSNYEKDNKTYQKLIQALDNKDLGYSTPKPGTQYTLGTATITILAPDAEYDNPNDASLALRIKNGNNTFLFTGDAGEDAEKDILASGYDISADVYKVGHHGSKYSTSADFFKAVAPSYAVISCAEGNSYGHPHAETLNTLRINGVKVYRTDEDGTIIATADGRQITFNVPASETWKAGEPTGSQQADTPQSKADKGNAGAQVVTEEVPKADNTVTTEITYVLNTKTMKFHKPSCSSLPTVNRKDTSQSRDSIIAQGYVPCKRCNP
ncbi:MAG: MBL fold metallo-hydrolase [Ruminococcus sp.]|nr:MBL fold metallo-hydrolase [Ruminococcus sp.]